MFLFFPVGRFLSSRDFIRDTVQIIIMEVVDKKEVLMSNYEVLQLLKEVSFNTRKKQKERKQGKSNLPTIVYETTKYLKESPSSCITDDATFRELLIQLKPFNLTKSEKLDIVNHMPNSLVELQLLIEDNEERFSEDDMQNILGIISSFVPGQQDDTDMTEETTGIKEEEGDVQDVEETLVKQDDQDDGINESVVESVGASCGIRVKSEN